MSDKEKQRSVDSFQQNDNIKVFIGNIKSAGVGITLTEATYVIFNSFSWVPGNNEQAEDRSYRIGQKNNVTVYYQLFNNTVSTIMWGTVKKKQSVIDSIINTKQIDDDESIRKAMEIILNEIIDNYE
jgi:SNF2 family DNA or RNA helicase